MKDLVAATKIGTEDFFAGNFDADPADVSVKKSESSFYQAAAAQQKQKEQ